MAYQHGVSGGGSSEMAMGIESRNMATASGIEISAWRWRNGNGVSA